MFPRVLRFATYLAPNMIPVYRFITRYVGAKLGCRTELFVGTSYEQMAGEADAAFLCGLAYVELASVGEPASEPLVAPVLRGKRYGGKPVYFSDVIVRRNSLIRSFAELRGRSWCYNEPHSHSGYGITRYRLARMGATYSFFGEVVEVGYHQRSIDLVCSGAIDASAIDSQVLAIACRDHPELRSQLRVIESFGPSTIQPLVVASRLSARLRTDLRHVLLAMGEDSTARQYLAHGLVQRFVPVTDRSYDDIREMRAVAEAANCPAKYQATPA